MPSVSVRKEARSPENTAASSAAESACATDDCITAGEKHSPLHVDRAPGLNHQGQDECISILTSKRVASTPAAVDQVTDLIVGECGGRAM